MRTANVAGRAVMAHGKEPIDVFKASGGRFGPSPSAVFDRWAEFRAWADVEYRQVPVVRDPAWLADERIGAPSPHPRQVFAIGLNYAEHARESGYDLPTTPVVFTIFTGTPSGIGMSRTPPRFLKPGDELVSHVEGIGKIRQQVVGVYAVPAPPRQTAAALAAEG
jgi:2-keto-4-pentenoate hydratase/2-oxohepta-3-ene-1,7-dioic acid hydratase in catechol pathway